VIVRVAVVPHPPLLVPELVAGHDPNAQLVRDECVTVAERLATAARRWVAIAADSSSEEPVLLGPDTAGTFRGYGVDVPVRLNFAGTTTPDPALPLPALIAGWLRERAGADEVRLWLVPSDLPAGQCEAFGRRLVAELDGEPVGLLVLGDGSHRHGERAVGRPDERAAEFDERVRRALAAADPAALLGVDTELAASLGAIGRAPWQVLAGVAGKAGHGWRCERSRLLIPFGVAYHLAVWNPVP
jgi:aromatic ring-opening dioxygenase LigB subunit